MSFDAIVLAMGDAARNVVCGLSLAERARRVAARAGAARVYVVDGDAAAAGLVAWVAGGGRDLLVLRGADQVVHFPLVDAVRGGGARIAVTADGDFAGAIWVPAGVAVEAATELARNPAYGDAVLARGWRELGRATTHVPGPIARHRAVTAAERRGATRMLFELVHKPGQDGWLCRHLFRPVAGAMTRVLLPTPVTPNLVTATAALLSFTGCLLVTGTSYQAAVIGVLLQHLACYFDCTDGEIARLRHEGSKVGMWFDTITDETTTVLCLGSLGVHVYRVHAGAWYAPYLAWSVPVGLVASLIAVYVIYFYLIRVARSGNSQDYPVDRTSWVAPLAELVHRDFISVVILGLALANLTEVAYGLIFTGAVVSAAILLPQHARLRGELAARRAVP